MQQNLCESIFNYENFHRKLGIQVVTAQSDASKFSPKNKMQGIIESQLKKSFSIPGEHLIHHLRQQVIKRKWKK